MTTALAADILVDVANPYMAELNQITGETVDLTEPDGLSMGFVARFSATKYIPLHMPIGSRMPMYYSGGSPMRTGDHQLHQDALAARCPLSTAHRAQV